MEEMFNDKLAARDEQISVRCAIQGENALDRWKSLFSILEAHTKTLDNRSDKHWALREWACVGTQPPLQALFLLQILCGSRNNTKVCVGQRIQPFGLDTTFQRTKEKYKLEGTRTLQTRVQRN